MIKGGKGQLSLPGLELGPLTGLGKHCVSGNVRSERALPFG